MLLSEQLHKLFANATYHQVYRLHIELLILLNCSKKHTARIIEDIFSYLKFQNVTHLIVKSKTIFQLF